MILHSPRPLALISLVTAITLAGCVATHTQSAAQRDHLPSSASSEICRGTRERLTVPVAEVFADGEWVRDFYSGKTAQVRDGRVDLAPHPDAEGLLLLEAMEAPAQPFQWAGATVYFVVTDRFANGRQDNDQPYGRTSDPVGIGTFHGGDFAGLTAHLDYLDQLGITALWLTPPFEQMHGWVGGGSQGDFRHYGYHGYYALDFTVPDASFGTREEFRTLVNEAHARGIRVVMDVVMNHPGYSTLQDMQTFGFGSLYEGFEVHLPDRWGDWQPEDWENLHAYHALIDYDSADWSRWWGKDWVRAGIADYDTPPSAAIDPRRGSLAFLPDFKTEASKTVALPPFLQSKSNTRAISLEDATVRQYLISWLTDWVREFGVDGFRVDTAKHVEPEAWEELKEQAQIALDEYRANHPQQPLPSDTFWMVAEVFPHGVTRSEYFDAGFDAVINFDLQEHAAEGARCLPSMEPVYANYASKLNAERRFNVMSYLSSHDTDLFSRMIDGNATLQKRGAAALLLTPGTSQIFYGDESGRSFGPSGSDPHQGTRSDMNWSAIEAGEVDDTLEFWRTLGQFRRQHPAIGAGEHRQISANPYVFSRIYKAPDGHTDRVIIAFGKEQP